MLKKKETFLNVEVSSDSGSLPTYSTVSAMSTEAGPSQIPVTHSLFGTVPGVLDPTQPSRLLRFPGSTLSFASFHPFTASNVQEPQRTSNGDEPCRPKRIVIESVLGRDGFSTWRFVPRARREQGVEDEGVWPRVIEICG